MESAIVNGPKHTDVSAAFRVPKDLNLKLVDFLIRPDDFYYRDLSINWRVRDKAWFSMWRVR